VSTTPTFVLGGTGYVAGELLRLIAQHPQLELAGVLSESRAGARVNEVFPQLQNAFGGQTFSTREELFKQLPAGPAALFSAAPHGASAGVVAEFLAKGAERGSQLTVVDVSAAVPEHLASTDKPHIGHPGCFATALLMATVPLTKLGLTQGGLHAVGITGSTGSGRSPSAGTHHPERHGNLYAYKPLNHRHAPEVVGVCENLTGTRPSLHFVPHSGPFARGIHVTVQARLQQSMHADDLRSALAKFYANQPFVQVRDGTPRIKDVAGSNACHLGVATDADSLAVFVVIDNLVKGAAGGAVQWMNRQLGIPETTGLQMPALAWI
jgi:N-acetyl-gamma-glutamyl-phosphate reductase